MDRTRLGLVAFLAMASCSSSNNAPESSDQAAVVRQHAILLDANYKDVILQVEALKVAVDACPLRVPIVGCRERL